MDTRFEVALHHFCSVKRHHISGTIWLFSLVVGFPTRSYIPFIVSFLLYADFWAYLKLKNFTLFTIPIFPIMGAFIGWAVSVLLTYDLLFCMVIGILLSSAPLYWMNTLYHRFVIDPEQRAKKATQRDEALR